MNVRYVAQELYWRRHRTLVNVLGIAIGIALFVSINAVTTAYQKAFSRPFQNMGADLVVQKPERRSLDAAQTPTAMRGIRLPFSNRLISNEDLRRLASVVGVAASASGLLLWEFDQGGFRTILGVDLSKPNLGPVKIKEWLKEGRFPSAGGEVVLEKHYAKFQRSRLGDTLALGGRSFTVVGLLEIKEGPQIASANVYLPLTEAQKLLSGGGGGVNLVYLRLQNPSRLAEVRSRIGREVPEAAITSSDSFLELMGGVAKISNRFSFLFSTVAFGGAVFLIIKTMVGNLVSRSSEIGVLKAVGWTEKDVQQQLLAEALLQALAGGLAGLTIGYVISYLFGFLSVPIITPWEINLTPVLAKAAAAPKAAAVSLPVSLSTGLSAAALALALLAGALATFFMGKRTIRIKPADILRRL